MVIHSQHSTNVWEELYTENKKNWGEMFLVICKLDHSASDVNIFIYL